jgi:hypothetical protein
VTRFSWQVTLYELPVFEDNGAPSKTGDDPVRMNHAVLPKDERSAKRPGASRPREMTRGALII